MRNVVRLLGLSLLVALMACGGAPVVPDPGPAAEQPASNPGSGRLTPIPEPHPTLPPAEVTPDPTEADGSSAPTAALIDVPRPDGWRAAAFSEGSVTLRRGDLSAGSNDIPFAIVALFQRMPDLDAEGMASLFYMQIVNEGLRPTIEAEVELLPYGARIVLAGTRTGDVARQGVFMVNTTLPMGMGVFVYAEWPATSDNEHAELVRQVGEIAEGTTLRHEFLRRSAEPPSP